MWWACMKGIYLFIPLSNFDNKWTNVTVTANHIRSELTVQLNFLLFQSRFVHSLTGGFFKRHSPINLLYAFSALFIMAHFFVMLKKMEATYFSCPRISYFQRIESTLLQKKLVNLSKSLSDFYFENFQAERLRKKNTYLELNKHFLSWPLTTKTGPCVYWQLHYLAPFLIFPFPIITVEILCWLVHFLKTPQTSAHLSLDRWLIT